MRKRTLSPDQHRLVVTHVYRRRQISRRIAELLDEKRAMANGATLAKELGVPRRAIYKAWAEGMLAPGAPWSPLEGSRLVGGGTPSRHRSME
jgi:hypothetical protein